MFNAFVITLREAAELLLIAEAIRLCVVDRRSRAIWHCAVAGIAIGVCIGALLGWKAGSAGLSANVLATLTLLFALAVMLLASGLLSSSRELLTDVQLRLDAWLDRRFGALWICGFGLVVGLRETLETTVFLLDIARTDGLQAATLGGLGGIAVAVALVGVYRSLQGRIGLERLFQISALFMVLVAAELTISAVSDLARLNLPAGSALLGALEPYLSGGPWSAWVWAAFIAPPLLLMMRRWWTGTAGSGATHRPPERD